MRIKKDKLVKPLIIILVIAILFTYVWPWASTLQIGSTSANLTVAFEGAGKGLDPQGNRFDVNGVKSDEVLEKAIQESGLEKTVTVDELKRRVYILPSAESDTLKELLTLTTISGKTEDIKERMVYPTSFTVGLKDMGLPAPLNDRKLLTNILKAYESQLRARYLSDTLSEPAYTPEEILQMDYPEMMKVLNQEADSLLLYINSYASNERQFVSKKTGLSFSDVYEQATLLKNTDIGTMKSLVDYYELTLDPPSRILYEDTMLRRAGVVANKLLGAQYTSADILQIYNNSSNYIFASGDTGSVNLAPAENQFYGDLVDALVNKQQAYIGAKYDQQDIQKAIAKLQVQAVSLTGDAYINLTGEIKTGAQKALTRIDELKKQTRDMAQEYYETSIGNKIYVSGTAYDLNSNGNIVINFIVLAALYILIGIAYRDLKRSDYFRYVEMVVQPFRRKRNAKK